MLRRLRQLSAFAAIVVGNTGIEAVAQQTGVEASGRMTAPELARSEQLLVVTATDWSAVSAELRCFERRGPSAPWREVLTVPAAVIGRNGLAWGVGVHGTSSADGPRKQEGDGKAPAGIFRLVEAFGFASAEEARLTRFPYRTLADDTEGIDDPASRYYNRLIDARSVAAKDWTSSERMRLSGDVYRWGVVVAHNWNQVPGAGSCIFLHVWEGPGVATSGCTAMPEEQMVNVIRWLDRRKNPLLVQLPEPEYRRLRSAWKLP